MQPAACNPRHATRVPRSDAPSRPVTPVAGAPWQPVLAPGQHGAPGGLRKELVEQAVLVRARGRGRPRAAQQLQPRIAAFAAAAPWAGTAAWLGRVGFGRGAIGARLDGTADPKPNPKPNPNPEPNPKPNPNPNPKPKPKPKPKPTPKPKP